MSATRTVHLPPEKIDECCICGSKESPKFCAKCAERVYCSVPCQTKDWKEGGHNKLCRKYHFIDLKSFYPYLAGVARYCHNLKSGHINHPCELYRIKNSPNPGAKAVDIPGCIDKAVLVEFGNTFAQEDVAGPKWWPKGLSDEVRRRLFRRMAYEGHVLAIHFVIALSILAEIYDGKDDHRLRYRSVPIADFGISKGTVRINHHDRLAYRLPDGSFRQGQDPSNHYWIYFTTAFGQDIILDFCLYTFNCSTSVNTSSIFHSYPTNMLGACPAYFHKHSTSQNTDLSNTEPIGGLHQERSRFSVLRENSLYQSVRLSHLTPSHADACFTFLEGVSEGDMDDDDRMLIPIWLRQATSMISSALRDSTWSSWPVVVTEDASN